MQVKKESQDENTETFTAGTRGNYEGGLGGRANDGEWQVQFQPSNAVDPRDPHRNDDSAFPNHAPDINSEEFPALEGSAAGGGSIISNRWVTKGNNGIGKSGISRGNTVSQANRKKTLEEDFPTLNKVEKKGGGSHSVLNDYNQKISANTNSSWGKKPSDSPLTEDQMIAQAIAESMNISNGNYSNTVSSTARPQGYQPMKVSITDQSAFPTLSSDESSNVTKVQSKPKPVKKAPAQAGWGDALKSVGMKAPQKKATGFSIVKTVTRKVDQSSVATKKSSIDSSGSNTIALPPPPNLANDNYPSLSISRNPREGKWVTMGGAGNHNK